MEPYLKKNTKEENRQGEAAGQTERAHAIFSPVRDFECFWSARSGRLCFLQLGLPTVTLTICTQNSC